MPDPKKCIHVSLRCDLNGVVADRFVQLKAELGLETNAELVRLLTMIGYLSIEGYKRNNQTHTSNATTRPTRRAT